MSWNYTFVNLQITSETEIKKSIYLVENIFDKETYTKLNEKVQILKSENLEKNKLSIIVTLVFKEDYFLEKNKITFENVIINWKKNTEIKKDSENLKSLALYFGLFPHVQISEKLYKENFSELVIPEKIFLRNVLEDRRKYYKRKLI